MEYLTKMNQNSKIKMAVAAILNLIYRSSFIIAHIRMSVLRFRSYIHACHNIEEK